MGLCECKTDTEGKEYTGNMVCVMDTEEKGLEEDDISIQINGDTIIGFLQSEISQIEEDFTLRFVEIPIIRQCGVA